MTSSSAMEAYQKANQQKEHAKDAWKVAHDREEQAWQAFSKAFTVASEAWQATQLVKVDCLGLPRSSVREK